MRKNLPPLNQWRAFGSNPAAPTYEHSVDGHRVYLIVPTAHGRRGKRYVVQVTPSTAGKVGAAIPFGYVGADGREFRHPISSTTFKTATAALRAARLAFAVSG